MPVGPRKRHVVTLPESAFPVSTIPTLEEHVSRVDLRHLYTRLVLAALEVLALAAMVTLGVAHAAALDATASAIAAPDLNPNLVLNGGFRIDLADWDYVDPAVSWNQSDSEANPQSGSLDVNEPAPTDLTEISAARQCIALPAPGKYRLTAKGDGGALPRFAEDYLKVRWALRQSDATCALAPTLAGEFYIPPGSGWTSPETPLLIEVLPAQWTPNATIELELVVERNANDPDTSGITGRFDAVSLTLQGDAVFADGFD